MEFLLQVYKYLNVDRKQNGWDFTSGDWNSFSALWFIVIKTAPWHLHVGVLQVFQCPKYDPIFLPNPFSFPVFPTSLDGATIISVFKSLNQKASCIAYFLLSFMTKHSVSVVGSVFKLLLESIHFLQSSPLPPWCKATFSLTWSIYGTNFLTDLPAFIFPPPSQILSLYCSQSNIFKI